MAMPKVKLVPTANQTPLTPRLVADRYHATGSRINQKERMEKAMVMSVWPAPLMTPPHTNITPTHI